MNSTPTYIGIDIGGTKTAVSLLNSESGILLREAFESSDSPDVDLEKVGTIISNFQESAVSPSAVGISVGAMFDPISGSFKGSPHKPRWEGFPIADRIGTMTRLPIFADNDANACALAEWRYGAGRNCKHLAFLTFGTGLGAGLILNGALYHGASALAGEIGALRIADDGPRIREKPGCLEGFSSGAGIAQLAEIRRTQWKGVPTGLPIAGSALSVATYAKLGDLFCISILEEAGEALGKGLSALIDLLNLEKIIIGSIFVRCENFLRKGMSRSLEQEAMPDALANCEIVPTALGEQIGDLACLALVETNLGHAPQLQI